LRGRTSFFEKKEAKKLLLLVLVARLVAKYLGSGRCFAPPAMTTADWTTGAPQPPGAEVFCFFFLKKKRLLSVSPSNAVDALPPVL
jgi:hypothetical protein